MSLRGEKEIIECCLQFWRAKCKLRSRNKARKREASKLGSLLASSFRGAHRIVASQLALNEVFAPFVNNKHRSSKTKTNGNSVNWRGRNSAPQSQQSTEQRRKQLHRFFVAFRVQTCRTTQNGAKCIETAKDKTQHENRQFCVGSRKAEQNCYQFRSSNALCAVLATFSLCLAKLASSPLLVRRVNISKTKQDEAKLKKTEYKIKAEV